MHIVILLNSPWI